MREKFGATSVEFKVAQQLLDQALPALVDRFAALYSESLVAQLVVLGAARSALTPSVRAAVERVLPTEASDEFFPAIYAARPGVDVASVCTALRLEFSEEAVVRVECRPSTEMQGASFVSTDAHAHLMQTGSSTTAAPTDSDIAIYQIVLWSSIGLAGALVLAINLLAGMENKRDTMLYSRFNPNWADRKRR